MRCQLSSTPHTPSLCCRVLPGPLQQLPREAQTLAVDTVYYVPALGPTLLRSCTLAALSPLLPSAVASRIAEVLAARRAACPAATWVSAMVSLALGVASLPAPGPAKACKPRGSNGGAGGVAPDGVGREPAGVFLLGGGDGLERAMYVVGVACEALVAAGDATVVLNTVQPAMERAAAGLQGCEALRAGCGRMELAARCLEAGAQPAVGETAIGVQARALCRLAVRHMGQAVLADLHARTDLGGGATCGQPTTHTELSQEAVRLSQAALRVVTALQGSLEVTIGGVAELPGALEGDGGSEEGSIGLRVLAAALVFQALIAQGALQERLSGSGLCLRQAIASLESQQGALGVSDRAAGPCEEAVQRAHQLSLDLLGN